VLIAKAPSSEKIDGKRFFESHPWLSANTNGIAKVSKRVRETCGLYYKHITIVKDASRVISG
jgi:hypothetical protein